MKFTPAWRWFLPVMALLVMALRIPIQTPWIDEAAIVTYGVSAWGIPSQLPDTKILYWLGSLFTYLFYEALPGSMGARWFSWLGAIFLLTMWELWARLNRVLATHRAVLAATLLLLPVVQFEGSNGRLDLWAIGWAFAAFTAYQTQSSPPRIRLLLTGFLAGISVAFWFTGLITLLLLPFLALTPDRSQGHFLADRFRELPLLLLGFVLPFLLMGIFRFDYMFESVEVLEAMIAAKIQMGTAEISSGTFVREPILAQTLIPTSLFWLISWGSRCPGKPGNRTQWFMEAGVVAGVLVLVVVSHLYHGRLVYWLPIPFAFLALNLSATPQRIRSGLMISMAVLGFGYSMFTLKARASWAALGGGGCRPLMHHFFAKPPPDLPKSRGCGSMPDCLNASNILRGDLWPDVGVNGQYADFVHLTESGARVFTAWLLEEARKMQRVAGISTGDPSANAKRVCRKVDSSWRTLRDAP